MNSSALLRSLVIFSICLPLAIWLGYTIAGPFGYTFVGVIGGFIFLLLLPLILRFHFPMLVLGWNATMIVFFLPGAPPAWIALAVLSLIFSIVERTIDRDFRFVSVKSVGWPLLILLVVILVTAKATGGIHMRALGGGSYGGRNYFLVIVAILGYFALTARAIPREKARLYVGLFLLGGLTTLIGDVLYFQNRALNIVYMFFPPNFGAMETQRSFARFNGVANSCSVMIGFMLAFYGIRGVLSARRPWRAVLFAFFAAASLLGGFRSSIIVLALLFSLQFCLEGLYRTKLLPILVLAGAVIGASTLPFVESFPPTVQRALSFLPIRVDPVVKAEAAISAEWRFRMWQAVLPQVPRYLLLGKGYIMARQDFDYMVGVYNRNMQSIEGEDDPMSVTGNYHNGPLSVTIPFGIWGDIAFVWFLAASVRVLYRNYRYGDPSLETVNTYLLAVFVTKIITFFIVYGALFSDLSAFVGYIAFGISLNGGMCRRPVPESARETGKAQPSIAVGPQLQPAFKRSRSRI